MGLLEGRSAFGWDPEIYAFARPEYPELLYARLIERCELDSGTSVFEIGAGTGLATKRLLALGASPLRAIEPDPRLAAYLRANIRDSALQVDQAAFEEVQLDDSSFDLGIAATSFHWLEQASSLAKVRRIVRTGGWWAMWWTHFGPEGEYDAFQSATDHLFANTLDSPSACRNGGPPFALDREHRLRDLTSAGFRCPSIDSWRWSLTYDTSRLVALYSTFSPIQTLALNEREQFLTELALIANDQFGGNVERTCVTVLYTAQNL